MADTEKFLENNKPLLIAGGGGVLLAVVYLASRGGGNAAPQPDYDATYVNQVLKNAQDYVDQAVKGLQGEWDAALKEQQGEWDAALKEQRTDLERQQNTVTAWLTDVNTNIRKRLDAMTAGFEWLTNRLTRVEGQTEQLIKRQDVADQILQGLPEDVIGLGDVQKLVKQAVDTLPENVGVDDVEKLLGPGSKLQEQLNTIAQKSRYYAAQSAILARITEGTIRTNDQAKDWARSLAPAFGIAGTELNSLVDFAGKSFNQFTQGRSFGPSGGPGLEWLAPLEYGPLGVTTSVEPVGENNRRAWDIQQTWGIKV